MQLPDAIARRQLLKAGLLVAGGELLWPEALFSAPAADDRPAKAPLIGPREIIKGLDGMKLRPDDRRKIYFGNAMRLLKLPQVKAKPAAKAKKKTAKKKK